MINDLNINIFNYIFSINEDINSGIKEDNKEYHEELNARISKICQLEDFWQEYQYEFNDNCILMAKTLSGVILRYNNFPRMKINTKKQFLSYKAKQIEESINKNGYIIKDEIDDIFYDIENLGRKTILDYCEKIDLIEYKGTVFISASGNPASEIIYDNIKPTMHIDNNSNKSQDKSIIQNVFNGNNYGVINQLNSIQKNDDKLFEIVLEKLKLMKEESNLSNETTGKIEEACNKKEKNKVINFLREIAKDTGTNLIANGILMMFGLM